MITDPSKESRYEYINNYQKEKYDRIIVNVVKGRKELIKKRAEELGMSLSEYAIYCVEKVIEGEME